MGLIKKLKQCKVKSLSATLFPSPWFQPTHTCQVALLLISYEVLSTKLKSMLLFPHPPILTQKEAYMYTLSSLNLS